jgi:hypothetical protein
MKLELIRTYYPELILIHPANEASHELKGCITPECCITDAGKGLSSRMALETLTSLVSDKSEKFVTKSLLI